MLKNQLGFSANQVTVTQGRRHCFSIANIYTNMNNVVVANLGAICGGTVVGYCSGIFGRRLSIIAMCILGGALVYPYGFVRNEKVTAVAFFEQFAVQGAWVRFLFSLS